MTVYMHIIYKLLQYYTYYQVLQYYCTKYKYTYD